jgi:uncharacterized membrane protein
MTNKELWGQCKEYTADLTNNARKLAFAAGAITWFFKDKDNIFPKSILFAIGFLVLFFICDILQFIFGALMIGLWTRKEEKEKYKETKSIEGDYDKPAWLDYPSRTFWFLKIVFLLLTFACIGVYIFLINKNK